MEEYYKAVRLLKGVTKFDEYPNVKLLLEGLQSTQLDELIPVLSKWLDEADGTKNLVKKLDDDLADAQNGANLSKAFKEKPELVENWRVLSSNSRLRNHIPSLNKIQEYLSHTNPSELNSLRQSLKAEFEASSFNFGFIDSFIGGPLRSGELMELNVLSKKASELYPQKLPLEDIQRKNILQSRLGKYEYSSALDNLSGGIKIRFKEEFYNPPENAFQTDGSWLWTSTLVKDNRIYGIPPLPFNEEPFDFVITLNGELRIGLGHFHLSGDAPNVLAAGRLRINNEGKVWKVDFESGHYRPGLDNVLEEEAIRDLFRKNNLSQFIGE